MAIPPLPPRPPSQRHVVGAVKDVWISIVPSPPQQLDAQDVKWNVKEEVAEGNGKRLAPETEFEPGGSHVCGVVHTGVCRG